MRIQIEFAVDQIIADIRSRSGIGNEWDEIGQEIQDEIREEWIQILEETINDGTK